MKLPDIWRQRTIEPWNARFLIEARCNHNVLREEHACGCLNCVAIPSCSHGQDMRAVPDGQLVPLYILLEVRDNLVAGEKSVRIFSGDSGAFQLRLPVGSVKGKGIPAMI